MTRHQYGISALVTQMSFCEGSSGDLAKRRLFSQDRLLFVKNNHNHDHNKMIPPSKRTKVLDRKCGITRVEAISFQEAAFLLMSTVAFRSR